MASAVAADTMPPHRLLLALSFLSLLSIGLNAQTAIYDWDADANAANGITNGTADWTSSGSNWRDSLGANGTWVNSYNSIARFGDALRVTGNTVTISGTMKLGGIDFVSQVATAQSVSGQQYTLTGGTAGVLDFGTGGVITMADGSSGGSPFVTFSNTLSIQGNNLTVRKSGGTTTQFITFLMTSNPQLTGTLTVGGANGGIFLRGNPNTFGAMDKIVVEANGTFSMTSAGTYNKPFEIAGFGGANQYGAIRVDASNTTLSGLITLTADAAIQTNTGGITGTLLTGGITEATPGLGFVRFAPGVGTGTFTFAAPSNYSGATTFGRSGFAGGINILDFSAAAAPVSDLIYNNVPTAGALNLIGGSGSATVLQVNGKASTTNSQRFGNVTASGLRSTISVTSGAGGSVNLTLGSLTRTGNGLLTLIKPQSGSIQVGNADGFLGPWATVVDANGESHWASAVGGELKAFTGDTDYTTGMNLSALPANSHLRVSDASSGAVELPAGTTGLGTLTQTDSAARVVALGSGKTLRLGVVGGLQIAPGSGDLTVGELGASGSLSAGGTTANAAGHLILSNQTKDSVLTVHSSIINNGTGAVALQVNGVPGSLTVLTAASTYTGGTSIAGGALEIRHANALGTAGTVTVLENATLRLNGGLAMTRSFTVAGSGQGGEGVLRSVAGSNTITGSITQAAPSKLVADAGSLTIAGATAITNVIVGTHALTFGGAGNITVTGRIATSTGTILKEGTGELILQGSNTTTGALTMNGGTLHLDFSPATAPISNILYNGVTAAALIQNMGILKLTGKSGASVSQTLGAYTVGGANTIRLIQNGASQVTLNFAGITRNAGGTLAINLPEVGAITTTGGTNNALLTGTGGVAYATVGLNDWAATTTAVSGLRNIVGLSSLNLYTASAAGSLATGANIDAVEPLTTISADTSVASLRFNTAQTTVLTQDLTGGRYLTTGGILVTPAVGANETLISTAYLRAPASATDLVIVQNNTAAPLRITAKITNNAAATPGVTGLTKTGPGTLILESRAAYTTGGATATYSGTTRIREGILQLVSGTGSAITYPLFPSADFILGSNHVSAKLVIGSGSVAMNPWGGLRIEGSGTANAVVGGATAMSSFHHYVDGVHDFRRGFLGGSGPNENNLSLTLSAGTLQLGPANTFTGKVTLLRNTVEVETLANVGIASSLGTGSFNAAAAIIDMGTQTTSTVGFTALATIRYIGSTDSVTNRPLFLANSDPEGDVAYAIAAIENTGTGTVKFTAPFTVGGNNKAQLIFRLGGTNTGANEINSIPELTVANPKAVQLEKNGTGTWILTGNSIHTGGTTITDGLLQLGNGGTGGSVNGGFIQVQSPGVLGLSRSDRHEISALISGSGSLTVANGTTGVSVLSNDNNALTGSTQVLAGSLLVNNPNGVGSPAGSGSITVAANATLGGSGRIAPAVGKSITLTGGRLSVGLADTAAGLLTLQTSGLGSLSLLENAVLSLDLFGGVGLGDQTGDASAADRVSIGGAVVLGTGATLQVMNASDVTSFVAGDSWRLFDWTNLSSLEGSFTQFDLPTLSADLGWDLSQLYTQGVLSVTLVVPEPGRAVLLGFAFVGLVLRRRRA